MTSDAKTWEPDAIARVQALLDRSAETATPVVGRVFARPDWRLSASEFLEMWSGQRWCTVASVGQQAQPHLALVHADFQSDGRLTMRMFTGSAREADILANPRVALAKNLEGAAATVYGRARVVSGTAATRHDAETVEVEVDVTRIYAMRPRRE